MYISAMKHCIMGYTSIMTRQLLVHMYAGYSNITAGILADSEQRMKAPYDPNQPIENLYT
jgi:hypothetical protein